MSIEGDENEDGTKTTEEVELWRQDPVECIRDLIADPAFKDSLAYAPEKAYGDAEGKERIYNEMWMGDWWWDVQVREMGVEWKCDGCCPRQP